MKLTELARKTLEAHFKKEKFLPDEQTKNKLKEKRACFVTLTKNNELRGCIGSLIATQSLYKDIMDNVINAALHDPRFSQLSEQELKEIKIEVSILSPSKKIEFKNPEKLLQKINNKMGIILKKDFGSSTFLPQVWEQLPDKTQFLEHLSLKAGLDKDAWKTAEISYYTVDSEHE